MSNWHKSLRSSGDGSKPKPFMTIVRDKSELDLAVEAAKMNKVPAGAKFRTMARVIGRLSVGSKRHFKGTPFSFGSAKNTIERTPRARHDDDGHGNDGFDDDLDDYDNGQQSARSRRSSPRRKPSLPPEARKPPKQQTTPRWGTLRSRISLVSKQSSSVSRKRSSGDGPMSARSNAGRSSAAAIAARMLGKTRAGKKSSRPQTSRVHRDRDDSYNDDGVDDDDADPNASPRQKMKRAFRKSLRRSKSQESRVSSASRKSGGVPSFMQPTQSRQAKVTSTPRRAHSVEPRKKGSKWSLVGKASKVVQAANAFGRGGKGKLRRSKSSNSQGWQAARKMIRAQQARRRKVLDNMANQQTKIMGGGRRGRSRDNSHNDDDIVLVPADENDEEANERRRRMHSRMFAKGPIPNNAGDGGGHRRGRSRTNKPLAATGAAGVVTISGGGGKRKGRVVRRSGDADGDPQAFAARAQAGGNIAGRRSDQLPEAMRREQQRVQEELQRMLQEASGKKLSPAQEQQVVTLQAQRDIMALEAGEMSPEEEQKARVRLARVDPKMLAHLQEQQEELYDSVAQKLDDPNNNSNNNVEDDRQRSNKRQRGRGNSGRMGEQTPRSSVVPSMADGGASDNDEEEDDDEEEDTQDGANGGRAGSKAERKSRKKIKKANKVKKLKFKKGRHGPMNYSDWLAMAKRIGSQYNGQGARYDPSGKLFTNLNRDLDLQERKRLRRLRGTELYQYIMDPTMIDAETFYRSNNPDALQESFHAPLTSKQKKEQAELERKMAAAGPARRRSSIVNAVVMPLSLKALAEHDAALDSESESETDDSNSGSGSGSDSSGSSSTSAKDAAKQQQQQQQEQERPKFVAKSTSQTAFAAHQIQPQQVGHRIPTKREYKPSRHKFDGTTTNSQSYQKWDVAKHSQQQQQEKQQNAAKVQAQHHQVHGQPQPQSDAQDIPKSKYKRHSFNATTEARSSFHSHQSFSPPKPIVRSAYARTSTITTSGEMDLTTSKQAAFKAPSPTSGAAEPEKSWVFEDGEWKEV
eukprot:TRINITY_DN65833_c5_g9_i1.p1 TRINITY_DN65833_c5_g9~~TRINITY_DN65833_c5_g9_i1.p1  ORF type:complete len:1030 (+),score=563.43 TRINITY_DN65833_c5_g9_i1:37-3126(+)